MTTTLIWFIVLILLSAFFSGMEIAYFSLSRGRVRTMVRQNLPGAKGVEKLRKKPQRLLVIILLGNNLVNIAAASLATKIAIDLFGSIGVGIATGIVTFLVLIFGEIFPKAIARVHAPALTRYTSGFILFLQYLFFPVVFILEVLSNQVTRIAPGKRGQHLISEDEVHSMMLLGVEEGSLQSYEKDFVERLFRFNDIAVKRILIPLNQVLMLDAESVISQASYFAAHSGYSRFPVYKNNKQNIIGIVHIKNIFQSNNSKNRYDELESVVQKVNTVSADTKLNEIFHLMLKKSTHMMLVRSKTDKIIGIVTIEDLLEELVGEIYDESDLLKGK
jgi:putative hemolysin